MSKKYTDKFIAAVVKRSGICRATVDQVLPAVFDELRCQLVEGSQCVAIDSFGTFAVVDIPERTRRYTYGGRDEIRTYQPKRQLKFSPARNMRQEIETGKYDPSRRSFTHHPSDPPLRTRLKMGYNRRKQIFIGQPPKD